MVLQLTLTSELTDIFIYIMLLIGTIFFTTVQAATVQQQMNMTLQLFAALQDIQQMLQLTLQQLFPEADLFYWVKQKKQESLFCMTHIVQEHYYLQQMEH